MNRAKLTTTDRLASLDGIFFHILLPAHQFTQTLYREGEAPAEPPSVNAKMIILPVNYVRS